VAIDSLLNVLKVPGNGRVAHTSDEWSRVENELGTKLPGDYKQFINRFGTCRLCDFIWVFDPFSKNQHLNLHTQVQRILEGMQVLQQKFEEERQYPLYPQRGGLLPWGTTDNGDNLFWLTSGSPEEWAIILNESRSPFYEQYTGDMSHFLLLAVTGQLTSSILPDDLSCAEPQLKQAG
jgi:hypothetical protein